MDLAHRCGDSIEYDLHTCQYIRAEAQTECSYVAHEGSKHRELFGSAGHSVGSHERARLQQSSQCIGLGYRD